MASALNSRGAFPLTAKKMTPQLSEALSKAKALSIHDKARLIQELMQTDDITVVFVNGKLAIAEFLNQIEKADPGEISQILLALADWVKCRARL